MIGLNTEIKIEYSETGVLYFSMWDRSKTHHGMSVRKKVIRGLETALRKTLQSFLDKPKGVNNDNSDPGHDRPRMESETLL